jgi:hypothetical protein
VCLRLASLGGRGSRPRKLQFFRSVMAEALNQVTTLNLNPTTSSRAVIKVGAAASGNPAVCVYQNGQRQPATPWRVVRLRRRFRAS